MSNYRDQQQHWSDDDDDDEGNGWVDWFLSTRGNEFFCEVDHEYIADRFNLTGLFNEVPHYSQALDILLDQGDAMESSQLGELEKSAMHLYGLIHARYILTGHGQAKMLEKYKQAEFGKCPRHLCDGQPMLPVGLTDTPFSKAVKLYCPRCEDVYHPRSSRHHVIDGAYFGTTFPHLFLLIYRDAIPTKTSDRYVPTIFGFRVHPLAEQMRSAPTQMVEATKMMRAQQQNLTAAAVNGQTEGRACISDSSD